MPGEPQFLNGWHDFEPASLLEPVAFFKDHEGIVHLKGRATKLDISGWKPTEESNSGAISGPNATTVGFDGAAFRAES